MPAGSLLALLDDIGSVLDDVAVLTKAATRKTAGVLGDDLALNAEQVAGVRAQRELPVVWAVAKGSFVNKAILVPGALALSAAAPWAVVPLLMVGGAYLCFEGFGKVWHTLHRPRRSARRKQEGGIELAKADMDVAVAERDKVRGAVRTDFVLSAEIVTIALGSVATSPFVTRLLVLAVIGVLMTVGVYGLVAVIVKLDDAGAYLCRRASHAPPGGLASVQLVTGRAILGFAPWIMRSLTLVGTVAMFLVGGGILLHGIPWAPALVHHAEEALSGFGPVGIGLGNAAVGGLCGIGAGTLAWVLVEGVRRALG
jgi:predicted DNA repair protein MutK